MTRGTTVNGLDGLQEMVFGITHRCMGIQSFTHKIAALAMLKQLQRICGLQCSLMDTQNLALQILRFSTDRNTTPAWIFVSQKIRGPKEQLWTWTHCQPYHAIQGWKITSRMAGTSSASSQILQQRLKKKSAFLSTNICSLMQTHVQEVMHPEKTAAVCASDSPNISLKIIREV